VLHSFPLGNKHQKPLETLRQNERWNIFNFPRFLSGKIKTKGRENLFLESRVESRGFA
jgi:hypothetical protein